MPNYEKSDEAGAEAPASKRALELTRLFARTPAMEECRQVADSIANKLDPEDTVSVQLTVPKEFIRLTEFLEQKPAADAGLAPLPAANVLAQILLNELHEQLHRLVVNPAHFAHYRNLWNRSCDEQGEPDQKIPDPYAAAPEEGDGPF